MMLLKRFAMKICSSFTEALEKIKSNSSIFIHGGAATPIHMIQILGKEMSHLVGLELLHIHTEGEYPFLDQSRRNIKITNFFTGKNLRGKIDFDSIDYLPCFLSEIPLLFRRGIKKIDVALVQVSPPDKHGFVSLGVSVDIAKAAVEVADMVIAHINPQMPRIHGNGFIHIDDIDYGVVFDTPIFEMKSQPLTETEKLIGKNVAALVEDGATLQLGIGQIPNAVAENLMNHKNLGLHTEMWSDGAYKLIKKGVINNSQKNIHRGISTSSFIMGSQEVYQFVDDNLSVINLEASYVNYPFNVIKNPKVTAINSAIEVDLTGQICADSIGNKIISGVGGQMDFMRSAALSEGGKPIIALTSRSPKGLSRITANLKAGAGVVTTRAHAHWIVTEYGAVNLYGKTIGERAKALISIAHPEDREMLERQWWAKKLLD
jgi:4-hydroxybutyrate CoA-transferase